MDSLDDRGGRSGGASEFSRRRHRADRRARRPRRRSATSCSTSSSTICRRAARRPIEVAHDRRAARAHLARDARRRSRRWAACRRTTTCRTAWCRGPSCRRCSSRIRDLETRSGLRIGNVFHAGDGNLHPLICYDERDAGPGRRAVERSPPRSCTYCIEAGGSITGEHGVGADKTRLHADDVQRRSTSTRCSACACAFDPTGLCNPGKVFPDAAAVRRSAGALSRASGRAGRARGAVLIAMNAQIDRARQTPASVATAASRANANGRSVVRPRSRRRSSTPTASDVGRSRRRRWSRRVDHVPAIWWRRCRQAARSTAANEALASRRSVAAARSAAAADRATIGGIVATNDSGPRRHRYGTPRDLIIGIELALADGRVAKAGGRVVKNVAGYDLSKLMCGSFGRLAVVTARRSSCAACAVLADARRDVAATSRTAEHACADACSTRRS